MNIGVNITKIKIVCLSETFKVIYASCLPDDVNGRLFQTDGAVTEKLRLPKVLKFAT